MSSLSTSENERNGPLQPTTRLHDELRVLRARYDTAQVSPAVYAAIRAIEIELAWEQHRR